MGSFEALAIGPYREQTKIAKNALFDLTFFDVTNI